MEEIEKTLKDLKAELVEAGMPEEEAEAFKTKGQVLSVLNTLKAKQAVEKVKTLEEVETPAEKKQFEKQWLSKAMIMKKRLEEQPKVRFLLPLEGDEKPGIIEDRIDKNGESYQFLVSGAYETVQLNGYKYLIPKGVYCNIPEQVADVLAKSYHQTQTAGSTISMDRVDNKTGKPMKDIM
jgi:hypothetical protein